MGQPEVCSSEAVSEHLCQEMRILFIHLCEEDEQNISQHEQVDEEYEPVVIIPGKTRKATGTGKTPLTYW